MYTAKEILGLRPLVFHVDAGWNSQIDVNYIERLVDGLGLDLFTGDIDWEEMMDLQRVFFRLGVSHVDTLQDHAFFASMYKFATQHGVKHILMGANYSHRMHPRKDKPAVGCVGRGRDAGPCRGALAGAGDHRGGGGQSFRLQGQVPRGFHQLSQSK